MEENQHTQRLSRTDLELFGRQLFSEFKKELDGLRDNLLSEMKYEQEVFRSTLLAEINEHMSAECGGTNHTSVPPMLSPTQEDLAITHQRAWDAPSVVQQLGKQEHIIQPHRKRASQKPTRKRSTAIPQEGLAQVTSLSNANPLTRGGSDPALCPEQETKKVNTTPADGFGGSSQQTLSPIEIERICRAFIQLINAPCDEDPTEDTQHTTCHMQEKEQ